MRKSGSSGESHATGLQPLIAWCREEAIRRTLRFFAELGRSVHYPCSDWVDRPSKRGRAKLINGSRESEREKYQEKEASTGRPSLEGERVTEKRACLRESPCCRSIWHGQQQPPREELTKDGFSVVLGRVASGPTSFDHHSCYHVQLVRCLWCIYEWICTLCAYVNPPTILQAVDWLGNDGGGETEAVCAVGCFISLGAY